jgi:hypothetical protein
VTKILVIKAVPTNEWVGLFQGEVQAARSYGLSFFKFTATRTKTMKLSLLVVLIAGLAASSIAEDNFGTFINGKGLNNDRKDQKSKVKQWSWNLRLIRKSYLTYRKITNFGVKIGPFLIQNWAKFGKNNWRLNFSVKMMLIKTEFG